MVFQWVLKSVSLSDLELSVISRYFTQNDSFRNQLHKFTEARSILSASDNNVAQEFLAIYDLWGTTRAISAVAELLVNTSTIIECFFSLFETLYV